MTLMKLALLFGVGLYIGWKHAPEPKLNELGDLRAAGKLFRDPTYRVACWQTRYGLSCLPESEVVAR